MRRPLVEAVSGRPTDRTPVWVMRQAGRYLPEYRALREKYDFQQAVSTPAVAAEITLHPIERYAMDGAVIFADIMTPLEAMGVEMEFAPGPRLRPHSLDEVANLSPLDTDRVGFVAETIRRVRAEVPSATSVIGFAGAPVTLLAYLVEGGGSKDFVSLRAALHSDPVVVGAALENLALSMNRYLEMQVEAGADVVQLFDSWAGVLDRATFGDRVVPAAQQALAGLAAPRIYFAPHSPHTLELQAGVGAECYGVDWRLPLDEAWGRVGGQSIQGNLDPAVLLTDPDTIAREVEAVLGSVSGRSGHVFNLGHGIDRHTPPENLAAMVEAVRR
ncbi:MAG TPA: uroporphyrinogen decarboxylase [Acidimicrobiia bacterium]|nr:uroporphyrinogen decarboxylase [Acidimicrobiia bacterium]